MEWRNTLNGKFSYDAIFCGIKNIELINELNASEEIPKNVILEKTYTYDIYTTIIHSVINLFSNSKDHARLYLRGQLDADEYINSIHTELVDLYLAYKNTPDELKKERGFYLKRVDKSYRDDLYTRYYNNIDDMFREIYLKYIDVILKKIMEKILLDGINNL